MATEEAVPVLSAAAPSSAELVDRATRALPDTPIGRELEQIFVVQVTYVGDPSFSPLFPQSLPDALAELDQARGWTREDLVAALQKVEESLVTAWAERTTDIKAATGMQGNIADLKTLTARFTSERAEQDGLGLNGLSSVKLDMVKTVSGQLGIPNPDAIEHLVEPKPKRSLGRGLLEKVAPYLVSVPKDDQSGQPKVKAGWLTEPILDEGDKHMRAFSIIARRAAAKADVNQIWRGLEELGYNRAVVTEILGQVVETARAQIAQSEEIKATVTAEYNDFVRLVEDLEWLRGAIESVRNFLNSANSAPQAETATA